MRRASWSRRVDSGCRCRSGTSGLRAARLLRKGARVRVVGQLRPLDYTPEGTDVRVPAFHLLAEDISLTLARVDEVRFAAKREAEGAGA